MQQVKRISTDRQRRVVPRRQIPQEVVGHVQAIKPNADEKPLIITALDSKLNIDLGHPHRSSARPGRDPALAHTPAFVASALAYGSLRSDERGHHLIADEAATNLIEARLISRIKVGASDPRLGLPRAPRPALRAVFARTDAAGTAASRAAATHLAGDSRRRRARRAPSSEHSFRRAAGAAAAAQRRPWTAISSLSDARRLRSTRSEAL